MKRIPLPRDSKAYAEQIYQEKERWHRRQARMSFARKLMVLDSLLESRKELPTVKRGVGSS